MEEVKKKFEYVKSATEESRLEFMPEMLYFMKLIDVLPSSEIVHEFDVIKDICNFIHSDEYNICLTIIKIIVQSSLSQSWLKIEIYIKEQYQHQ